MNSKIELTNADDLAVYVHWPFCASKCPYCDFNSHVRPAIDPGPWANAYAMTVRRYARRSDLGG